jgi:aquaporin Z
MKRQKFLWQPFLSESIGTAILIMVGLSVVILMFGSGTPIARWIPREGPRRLITGFLFGSTGALIAISPVGKESGAHINPIVTMAFWLMGKIDSGVAAGYVLAQLTGACIGALPLLAWGSMGRSIYFGATIPGQGYALQTVFFGEAITTFIMVSLLITFVGFRSLRRFTPAIFPILYCIMVYIEAPISGTSTNPARSFGPAVLSGVWKDWWIYWFGPVTGAFAATLVCSFLAKRIEVAKLYRFDSDRDGLFRRMGSPANTVHPVKNLSAGNK